MNNPTQFNCTSCVVSEEVNFHWGVLHQVFKRENYADILFNYNETMKSVAIYHNISQGFIGG